MHNTYSYSYNNREVNLMTNKQKYSAAYLKKMKEQDRKERSRVATAKKVKAFKKKK